MSTRRRRNWLLVIAFACSIVAVWLAQHHHEPAPQRVATPIEPSEPAAELTDDPLAPAAPPAPQAAEPSPPRAEAPQPSAADAPASDSTPSATIEFENTPRKRSAEPMRLHFVHAPEKQAPGIGLSKAACDELRERQLRAESLSDRERMHLRIDCRGR